MSEFIQIGDRIFNKAHIVTIDYRHGMLAITTTEYSPQDTSEIPGGYYLWGAEAGAQLWEQLQHYLAPTVIQISEK